MLRNVLRNHPNLCCPEETHFYRWGHPFRTPEFCRPYTNGPLFRKHRELDGVDEESFLQALQASLTREELMERYFDLFKEAKGYTSRRVFDKSPQNIYGIPLILSVFPEAKLMMIVRNPFNVVSSLKEGRQMRVDDLVGAANYWIEAIRIIMFFKKVLPHACYVVKYEEFILNPHTQLQSMMSFVGEEYQEDYFDVESLRPERNLHLQILTDQDRELVKAVCGREMVNFGYDLGEVETESDATSVPDAP